MSLVEDRAIKEVTNRLKYKTLVALVILIIILHLPFNCLPLSNYNENLFTAIAMVQLKAILAQRNISFLKAIPYSIQALLNAQKYRKRMSNSSFIVII